MSKINEVAELVEKGKAKLVGPAVQEAIDEGDDPVAILNDGMISAMSIVGDKFEVIDLGVDVPAAKIIECYKENPDVKIIALSALLTTTMPALKETVEALNAADFRGNIKVMVGGAPITEEFAEEIGADGYSDDAASAASLAKKLAAA